MSVHLSQKRDLQEHIYRKAHRILLVDEKKMDRYSKRFLWLATQMLSDCELEDASEQAELREIVRRLREMSMGAADEMSSERIFQKIGSK